MQALARELPAFEFAFPAEQSAHMDCAAVVWYFPAKHSAHEVDALAPVVGKALPTGQLEQFA